MAGVTSAAQPVQHRPVAPAADPVAIRACLSPELVAVFDREWEIVLDRAKASKDLGGVQDLLQKWRHFAYAELADPGSYFRVLAQAARIQATGRPAAGSMSGDEVRALIAARLAEAAPTDG